MLVVGNEPQYIIADLSANHIGKLDTAVKVVEEANEAGADAVKRQTHVADTITVNSDTEECWIHGGRWDGKTLHQF